MLLSQLKKLTACERAHHTGVSSVVKGLTSLAMRSLKAVPPRKSSGMQFVYSRGVAKQWTRETRKALSTLKVDAEALSLEKCMPMLTVLSYALAVIGRIVFEGSAILHLENSTLSSDNLKS